MLSPKALKNFREKGWDSLPVDSILPMAEKAVDEILSLVSSKITKIDSLKGAHMPLYKIFSNDPGARNLLYKYLQRIPSLYRIAGEPSLLELARALGITEPSVREAKIQMYLPWEKCFFQPCHQDINSLDSERSVTFWIPLHEVDENSAVTFWNGSHREGPVRHEEFCEDETGSYHVGVPEDLQKKYQTEKSKTAFGEIVALNRIAFHKSPEFETQLNARWTIVVRYDDLSAGDLYLDTSKYSHLTPFPPHRYANEILPKIREFLSRPPPFHWPELYERRKAGLGSHN
jgi:hypothetical protein